MIDDIRLPEFWSKGSTGGPEFLTGQVPLSGGGLYRAKRWEEPLNRYDIAGNARRPADIGLLNAFFRARFGPHRGFLLKDWIDYRSSADGVSPISATDCALGVGDGATVDFQLVKRYPDAIAPTDRPIRWPVAATLEVAVDGVPEAGVTVDRGTGIVTFAAAPAAAAVLTAGFEFDVPVHFVEDWLQISWDTVNSRSAGSVPIEELRPET